MADFLKLLVLTILFSVLGGIFSQVFNPTPKAQNKCATAIEKTLGREVSFVKRSEWAVVEIKKGLSIVPAQYVDQDVKGTMWCLLEGGTEVVFTTNRYQELLDGMKKY